MKDALASYCLRSSSLASRSWRSFSSRTNPSEILRNELSMSCDCLRMRVTLSSILPAFALNSLVTS